MQQEEREILKRHMVDACVKVANSSGCSDAVGVLRGALILAEGPVSMDELVEETGYSKSTVSANMSTLERQGLAKRVIVPGDKRYYYLAVSDPDSLKKEMIINMRQEIQLIVAAINRTEEDLKSYTGPSDQTAERVRQARSCYQNLDLLLDLISRYSADELIRLLESSLPDKSR
ncbi:MAG TPA: MarR family transcriptional regulator, partial [Methanothrix sp.]|nr:MarR family transcriptional regulator [Methanothrix sp.]